MASSTTVALVSKSSFIVALNIFPIWSYSGGGEVVPANPLTAISVIDAQLFSVLPLTVILTNLPTVFAGKLYLSGDKVVPVLFPVNTSVKVLPSYETDIKVILPLISIIPSNIYAANGRHSRPFCSFPNRMGRWQKQ
jgi:hypothetical protein